MTVAPKTAASEMQHDEHRHDHTEDGEDDLESQAEVVAGRLAVRLLRYFTPLLLDTSPVASSAQRFVHRQRRGCDQHQQASSRVDHL